MGAPSEARKPAIRRCRPMDRPRGGRRNGEGPAGPPCPGGQHGPRRAFHASPAPARRGVQPCSQAAIGLANFSTATVMRADSGAKEASASFSAASCSFAVSEKLFSRAARV